jgi:hypothetical protein
LPEKWNQLRAQLFFYRLGSWSRNEISYVHRDVASSGEGAACVEKHVGVRKDDY